MEEQNIEDLGLKPIETWSRDKDGNLIKVKLYWQNNMPYATLKFYDFTSK